jgi:hypothetical protein
MQKSKDQIEIIPWNKADELMEHLKVQVEVNFGMRVSIRGLRLNKNNSGSIL